MADYTEIFFLFFPECRSDASHQVSSQSDLWFGRRCLLKNFKMAAVVAILDIGKKLF